MITTTKRIPVTHANSGFRRFKTEVHHPVREAEAKNQSYLERARKTREMLRGMTVKQLLELIELRPSLDFFEALGLAKQGYLVIPNDIYNKILTETEDKTVIMQLYRNWKWTGTLVIYEWQDKPFGEKVFCTFKDYSELVYSISFQIPEQFRGMKNCALALEHPDFEAIALGENRYEIKSAEGANITLIENFPEENYYYAPHPETKIPQGEKVIKSDAAMYLFRSNPAYIGFLVRDVNFGGLGGGLAVIADFKACCKFGVAVVPLIR